MILFSIQVIALSLYAAANIFYCNEQRIELSANIRAIADGLYLIQYALLLFILFYRIDLVFKGSGYELSKFTVFLFITLYILSIVFGALTVYTLQSHSVSIHHLFPITATIFCVALLSTISMLPCLFIYKLMAVHKDTASAIDSSSSSNMISTITKISLLSSISILSFIFSAILPFLIYLTNLSSIHMQFLFVFIGTIDMYTNFISVILTFGSFNRYYVRLCGLCDIGCKRLCQKCMSSPSEKPTMERMRTTSSDAPSQISVEVRIEIGQNSPLESPTMMVPDQSSNSDIKLGEIVV